MTTTLTYQQDQRGKAIKLLADSQFFRGAAPTDLERILDGAFERRVPKGAFFFQQGDPAENLYLLRKGGIKLTQLSADGEQIILRYVGPGQMFGGIAMLGETIYPASAEASEASTALVWHGDMMRQVMIDVPTVALNALEHLAKRVQDLQDRLREMTTERVEQRIARALLRLAAQAGKRTDKGVELPMPISRQDLADLTGTSLYTVSRTLSRWEQDGLMQTRNRHIVLLQPHGLVKIADDLSE